MDKTSYHPVPDGRFYTKANFFTLEERNEVDGLSNEDNRSEERKTLAGAVLPVPLYYPKSHITSQAMRRTQQNHLIQSANYDDEMSDDGAVYTQPRPQTLYETDAKPNRLQPLPGMSRADSFSVEPHQQMIMNHVNHANQVREARYTISDPRP